MDDYENEFGDIDAMGVGDEEDLPLTQEEVDGLVGEIDG